MIGLGIDTGGTCTDMVVFDTGSKKVLTTGKALTTKENLLIGITNVLDQIEEAFLKRIDFVSLSTTLATNACVENRGGRVKLLMVGHLPKNRKEICTSYGFDSEEDIYFLEGIPEGGFCRHIEPDWNMLKKNIDFFREAQAIGVVQFYPSWNESAYEKKASEILGKSIKVPIVCGSSLFTDINAYRRAAGTYLNARLIPIIADFLNAVKKSLESKHISVPIYIMRSDGSLMNEEFAKSHPVETLLCGPAASAMGGMFGLNLDRGLVVDMGGTTTDMAMIHNNVPAMVQDGIRINGWKTFVKGMMVDTYGLGGDSCVRFSNGEVYLEPFRVIPVSYIGNKDASLTERILNVSNRHLSKSGFFYEGFVLQKNPQDISLYTNIEKKMIEALMKGPLLLHEISEAVKTQIKALPFKRLEKEGVIMRFGLTPTDIMHIKGDYTPNNLDTAKAAVVCAANFSGISREDLPDMIYKKVKDKLYYNIIRLLIESEVPEYKEGVSGELVSFFKRLPDMRENLTIRPCFKTDYKMIGVGAPTHIFLPEVAEYLGTEYVRHKYDTTANALGTLVGQVAVRRGIEITYNAAGYKAYVGGREIISQELPEVEESVRIYLKDLTEKIARERGAVDNLTFDEKICHEEYSIYGDKIVLKTTVEITAHGYIRMV